MNYLELLDRLHSAIRPAVYLEIGVDQGDSLALSRSRSIAIDPSPQLQPKALRDKPWVKLYQSPSDEFFRTHTSAETLEGFPLDLAFIDGLHEFAQVVRDLENVEHWGHADTIAVIHDVLPRGTWEATRVFREWSWTGDVWRTVSFLRELRPDLRCRLVDAEPTGALVVTQFDPAHRGMSDLSEALDRDFPPDGEEYLRLVDAYLAAARPESPEAVLKDLPGKERPVRYRTECHRPLPADRPG